MSSTALVLTPQSRLSRNVVANLVGVGWNGLLTIVATPFYISLVGMEGYGLIGFWLVLQAVLALCDLGLGATVLREFAASEGGPNGRDRRHDLLLTLEFVYWPIAGLLTGALFLAGSWIGRHWLTVNSLTTSSVTSSVRWMAIAIGLQFPNALYFSGLAGLQRQGRLNLLQIAGNTLRHAGGVAILYWRPDPMWFFAVQTVVTGCQTLATRWMLWRVSDPDGVRRPQVRWALVKDRWRFSAGMASTMIGGVLLANTDRLFLSKLLPATELGKYAVAWTAAGFLQLGVQPFYRAYFPRFAELHAAGETGKLRAEYYQGCRIVAAFIVPFAIIGWVFAPQIFTAWIGVADQTIVAVFRCLLVGVGAAGLMWLPAAFQQAQGWTRLHAAMILAALVVGVPGLWWTIGRWGAAGATAVWVLHGTSDLTVGLWLMHQRLLRGEFLAWWRSVILPPLVCALPLVALSWLLLPPGLDRWAVGGWLGATALVAMPIAVLCTGSFWRVRVLSQS
jgi:O-antigen/teichoic acid export membrane protein